MSASTTFTVPTAQEQAALARMAQQEKRKAMENLLDPRIEIKVPTLLSGADVDTIREALTKVYGPGVCFTITAATVSAT